MAPRGVLNFLLYKQAGLSSIEITGDRGTQNESRSGELFRSLFPTVGRRLRGMRSPGKETGTPAIAVGARCCS